MTFQLQTDIVHCMQTQAYRHAIYLFAAELYRRSTAYESTVHKAIIKLMVSAGIGPSVFTGFESAQQ